MKKIRPIKKNCCDGLIKQTMVKEKKQKMIRDKLKDEVIRDIWVIFETEEEKEERKKKKHNERTIKDRTIRDIRTLFEQEEDYYDPKRVTNFWNINYCEYESNGDKNKDLTLDKYRNKIKHYLMNIIIDLQNEDAWKIQLTIAVIFISSKYAEEQRVMHSSSGFK